MKDFRSQAEALRGEMSACRRDLHQHPELGFEEIRTAGIVAQTLTELGLEVQTGVGKTGVIGLLEGNQDGPTVMVRSDMDALPITEENTVDYCSQTPGKMHACGHDGHTTIGLTVARLLANHKEELKGRVKFVFQPSEETGEGAPAMIDDGALLGPTPDVFFGLHLWNELPVGEVALTPNGIMAGASCLHVQIKGRGGHGAIPNLAIDPVMATIHGIAAYQSIVSRNVDPLETAVVSITQVQTGNAFNIIPDQASFHGTVRTFKPEIQQLVHERLTTITHGIAKGMECQSEITFDRLSPPVLNDPVVTARLAETLAQIAPDLTYRQDYRTMAAEDVAFFLEKIPGTFFLVGSANASRQLDYPHHHPRFDFDEESLVIGATLLATAVADYVLPN